MNNVVKIRAISAVVLFLIGSLACSQSRSTVDNDDPDAGEMEDASADAGGDEDQNGGETGGSGGDYEKPLTGGIGGSPNTGGISTGGYGPVAGILLPIGGYSGAGGIPIGGAGGIIPIGGTGGFLIGGAGGFPISGTGGVIYPAGGFGGIPYNPGEFTDDPWDPPIADLEEPGWKDSDEPLCTNIQGWVASHSVWSDSRGVFALVSGESGYDYYWEWDEDRMIDVCVGDGCPTSTIYFNDGSGWEIFYRDATTTLEIPEKSLTGFPGGALITYGWEELYEQNSYTACGLATIDNGTKRCEPVSGVDHVFVVNDNLAYGIYEGEIIRYDGNSWGPLPIVAPDGWMKQLWADETHLFVTMDGAGRIVTFHDDNWYLQDTRTLQNFDAIWGFSATDVWAGTSDGGLYHFDGEQWTEVDWDAAGCQREEGIQGMWGDGGTVYFYTSTKIARVTGTEVEVLNSWPCPDYESVPWIRSVWGNSSNEVFFSIIDEGFPRRECGIAYVVRFDGSSFHQM